MITLDSAALAPKVLVYIGMGSEIRLAEGNFMKDNERVCKRENDVRNRVAQWVLG